MESCPACHAWLLEDCAAFTTDAEGNIIHCEHCQFLYPVDSSPLLNTAEEAKEESYK